MASSATYNGALDGSGENTYGGYSETHRRRRAFRAERAQRGCELAGVAPLLCAGITTCSPLRHWKAGPGKKVGVVGIGGLGHMGVKLAHALGAHVVAFTTSDSQDAPTPTRSAPTRSCISTDTDAMAARADSFDFILDTVAASHDLDAYIRC